MLRRVGLAFGLAVAVSLPWGTGTAGAAGEVSANAQGWWDVQTSVPQTPLGGNVPSLSAPASDVPEGVLPVTMRLGQPARVAAIGITVDAPPGSTVNKLVMTLKESDAAGAQQGSDTSVKACSITSFLVPQEKGRASDAPEADCSVGEAVGERSDDGTWTFDLTEMAQAWFDPFQSVPVQGVRLDPVGDAPATFQVGFTGYADATFETDIIAAAGGDDAFTSGGTSSDSFSGSSGGGDFSAPTATLPPVSRGTGDEDDVAAAPRQRVAPVVASRAGDTIGNFPLSIIPATLGTIVVAILASWAMGPRGGHQDGPVRRQRGVSRALAQRVDSRGRRG